MSRQNYIIFVVILLLTQTTSFIEARNSWVPWYPKTSVVVRNEVEGGRKLTLHCKSRDDDIGVFVLLTHEGIKWNFRPNIFGTTLFYCSADWGEGVHWFDIYVFKRDILRCTYCQWAIRKSGPCFFDSGTRAFDFCLPWH
ncbi:unnamed protein product [Linum tenue]|uniref:S-protein homolog n=1 Tax=Linum tenue TaxID=586396 RepID=A0AAV0LU87_9ROSI|nr:unnamed protein product [Linum tenue]